MTWKRKKQNLWRNSNADMTIIWRTIRASLARSPTSQTSVQDMGLLSRSRLLAGQSTFSSAAPPTSFFISRLYSLSLTVFVIFLKRGAQWYLWEDWYCKNKCESENKNICWLKMTAICSRVNEWELDFINGESVDSKG